MKHLFIAIALLFTITLSAQKKSASDTLAPLQIIQQYVSPNGFPGKMKFFCCELAQEWYADSTLGQHLPKKVQRDCQLIFQDTAHATVAVWLHDSVTSKDVYFYLVKKQNWTVFSARSLVMTSAAEQEIKRLDTLPKEKRGKVYTATFGHTYTFDYNNLKLWSSSDTNLVSYFHQHKNEFVSIQKSLVKKGYYGKSDSLIVKADQDKKIKKSADKLFLRNFEYDKRYPGCVFYVIGGMVDNTVGYMYQPDPKKVPLITEKHYILIRSLGDGWYLFKTT